MARPSSVIIAAASATHPAMYAGRLAQALILRTCVLRGPVWVANERVLHLAIVKSHLQDFYHQYAGGASSSRWRRFFIA